MARLEGWTNINFEHEEDDFIVTINQNGDIDQNGFTSNSTSGGKALQTEPCVNTVDKSYEVRMPLETLTELENVYKPKNGLSKTLDRIGNPPTSAKAFERHRRLTKGSKRLEDVLQNQVRPPKEKPQSVLSSNYNKESSVISNKGPHTSGINRPGRYNERSAREKVHSALPEYYIKELVFAPNIDDEKYMPRHLNIPETLNASVKRSSNNDSGRSFEKDQRKVVQNRPEKKRELPNLSSFATRSDVNTAIHSPKQINTFIRKAAMPFLANMEFAISIDNKHSYLETAEQAAKFLVEEAPPVCTYSWPSKKAPHRLRKEIALFTSHANRSEAKDNDKRTKVQSPNINLRTPKDEQVRETRLQKGISTLCDSKAASKLKQVLSSCRTSPKNGIIFKRDIYITY